MVSMPRGVHILQAHTPEGGMVLFAVSGAGVLVPNPETDALFEVVPATADPCPVSDALWARLTAADPAPLVERPTPRRKAHLALV